MGFFLLLLFFFFFLVEYILWWELNCQTVIINMKFRKPKVKCSSSNHIPLYDKIARHLGRICQEIGLEYASHIQAILKRDPKEF